MSNKQKHEKMNFENLLNLHEKAVEILELITDEERDILNTQESADNFKARFGTTHPEFANELLTMNRTKKRLSRSYKKIIKEIYSNESN